MSIISDQRIAHFDRPVKLRSWRGLGRTVLRAKVKQRRGVPSGNVSHDLAMAQTELWIEERRGVDVSALKARLAFRRQRERLLARKRDERARVTLARRPSIKQKINRSRRLREYIRLHEEQQARWSALESELG